MTSEKRNEIIKKVKFLSEKLNHFPSIKEMENFEKKLYGQVKNLGGITRFRQILNFPVVRAERNFWSKERIIGLLRKEFMKGSAPTLTVIKEKLGSTVLSCISKFGGIEYFRNLLGWEQASLIKTSDGHLVRSVYEYYLDEYLHSRRIKHEVDDYINKKLSKYRYDFKINDIYIEIWGLNSTEYKRKRVLKEQLYSNLNLNLISLERHVFLNKFSVIEKYLDELMESLSLNSIPVQPISLNPISPWSEEEIVEKLVLLSDKIKKFPTIKDLLKNGLGGMYDWIYKTKGLNYYRKILKFKERTYIVFWTEEIIIDQLNRIIKENGDKFPEKSDFKRLGYIHVLNKIAKNGGINYYREMYNSPIKKREMIIWNESIIIKHLKEIKDKIGKFPQQKEMLDNCPSSGLYNAILKYGGINKFKVLMNEKSNEEKLFETILNLKETVGRFPTAKEISNIFGLTWKIKCAGGINRILEKFNFKRVLIIGGTGYIGSALYEFLNKREYIVDVVDLEWFGNYLNIDTYKKDFKDLDKRFLRNYSSVILLAGHSSVKMSADKNSVIRNNIDNYIFLSKILNPDVRFIAASSASVYNGFKKNEPGTEESEIKESLNFYDFSKKEIDKFLKSNNKKNHFNLRFGTVCGPSINLRRELLLNSFVAEWKEKGLIKVFNKEINRPCLGIHDLCRAVETIITNGENKGGIYNLKSFEFSIEEYSRRISSILNCKVIDNGSIGQAYDFSISTQKFENTFNFQFKDTPESITKDLLENWNKCVKTNRNTPIKYD